MHRLVVLVTLALAILATSAAARDGAIVSRRPYRWVAWDSLRTPERIVTREGWERARADTHHVFERLEYRSGDRVVPAYVVHARRPFGSRAPAVVYVRGSWTVGDIGWQLAPALQRLAGHGYVVIAPLLRGSDGAPGPDEMGGGDLADLMNAVPLAAALGIADTSRLFLYGESRGGMMVFQAIRDGFPARAAATFGAFTDLDSMIDADTTVLAPVARTIWPDWPSRRSTIAPRRSAARWADRLDVPLLLMHGEADDRLPPAHTTRLGAAMRRAGRRAETWIVPGAGHALRGHEAERDSAAITWFRRFDRSR